MRIKTASIASALLILPLAVPAQAADGRVYYKDGTRIETEDLELKFNVQLQPRYTYSDFDSDRDQDETSGVRLRRARLGVSGSLMDKQFSFMLLDDFSSDSGGSDMKDAWIQYNAGDVAGVRFGQFKVPFTRQYNQSSSKLFFAERSNVINEYDRDRDLGAMVHGAAAGDAVHWYAGVFNGEGANSGVDDTDHRWSAALDFVTGDYGSRGEEGDLKGADFGATAGVTALYEQDEEEGADVDVFAWTADVGIRTGGLDLQFEVVANDVDLDEGEDPMLWGFYGQAMYAMDKWGFGVRFGQDDRDEVEGIDDIQEYTGVVNYFINGHALKLQNQITFVEENPVEGSSLTDFTYMLQLAGYF